MEEFGLSKIDFSRAEKEVMVAKLKSYFSEELNYEIGGFDAEFLIDFFEKELGVLFYNKGLRDAQSIISTKVEEIVDTIYEIEKPVSFK
jgi:uncharacterized protein (DUF2164 family)